MSHRQFPPPDAFRNGTVSPAGTGPAAWNASRSPVYPDMRRVNSPPQHTYPQASGVPLSAAAYGAPIGVNGHSRPPRPETAFPSSTPSMTYPPAQPPVVSYHTPRTQPTYGPLNGTKSPPPTWNSNNAMYSSTDSVDDIIGSSNMSDCSMDDDTSSSPPTGTRYRGARGGGVEIGSRHARRRPSNRDEFDGPHHFLQRPSTAVPERDLPHLPTNLPIQEQDCILRQMQERLSQCAFDFVAKYQFPIPLAPNTRPVERALDRDWVEWVYLLKRLATKRRIPARVLYNGQIKQFVPTLEHSLEMRYAPRNQRRPLKDDRHVLQLLSAGIQVAKILKDAAAMEFLDTLYCSTENQIQERAPSRYRK